jgi:hypothetical protein
VEEKVKITERNQTQRLDYLYKIKSILAITYLLSSIKRER